MITKNKFFFILILSLVSCKSFDIKPGSERIRVFETEPKGCIFLGEIPAVQENNVTPAQALNIEMELPTRVELRNKAYSLSGNVIIFMNKNKSNGSAATTSDTAAKKTTPQASATTAPATAATSAPPAVAANDPANEEKKVVTVFLATVFRCPPNIVNQ